MGDIYGTGSLIQAGSAATTLSGTTAYTGKTTITKGTLALGPGASLGSSSGMTLASAGAVLDLTRAGDQSLRQLAGASGSTVRLGSGTLTVATSGTARYGGSITGTASGGVSTAGTGTLTLTGSVATPSRTWHLRQGTLVLGPNATMSVSSLTQDPGETLSVDLGAASGTASGALAHGSGSPVITADGAVRLSGTLSVSHAPGGGYPAKITLIHDENAGAIAGTFSGLRQPGAITVNGHKYLITYAADGGHDVILTAASAGASATTYSKSPGAPLAAGGARTSVTRPAGFSTVTAVVGGLAIAAAGVLLLLLRSRGRRSGGRHAGPPSPVRPPLRGHAPEWDAAPPQWAPGEPTAPDWRSR